MEYARRRRRRARAGRGGAGKVIVVLLLLAAAVYLISASAVGTWLAENVVAPLFQGESQAAPTAAPDVTPAADAAVTSGEIEVPAIECFALQLGAYRSEVNADAQAREIRSRGAGGYVLRDGERYRVLAAGYASDADLQAVRAQLLSEGMDSAGYTISAPESVLRVTATETQQAAIAGAFHALWAFQRGLGEAALAFDREQQPVEAGRAAVEELRAALLNAQAAFDEEVSDTGEVLGGVRGCFRAMLRETENMDDTGAVAFSAALKRAHLGAAAAYAELGNPVGACA